MAVKYSAEGLRYKMDKVQQQVLPQSAVLSLFMVTSSALLSIRSCVCGRRPAKGLMSGKSA